MKYFDIPPCKVSFTETSDGGDFDCEYEERVEFNYLPPVILLTGKIDIDKVVSKMSASQRGSSDIIIKAIRDMESEGASTVNRDALVQRAVSVGLAREQAEEVIDKLLAEGILYSPREGKIRHSQS
jgi:FixJ family two-component response regulator